MSKKLVFYTNPMSRGRIVRWMLEEVGMPYETIYLEYGRSMKSADFLAINPMGKVPALTHGNVVVTECAAIITYLAELIPELELAPGLEQRGAYYRWLFFAAGPFEQAVTNQSLGFIPPADKQGMVGYGSYESVLDSLEGLLDSHDFVLGDKFSAADVYLGSQIGFGLQFGSIEKRPSFTRYWDRLNLRPAWRRSNDLDNAALSAAEEQN